MLIDIGRSSLELDQVGAIWEDRMWRSEHGSKQDQPTQGFRTDLSIQTYT